jgi:hypothetical protein
MADDFSGYSGLFKGVGGLIGGIISSGADEAQAKSYQQAGDIAGENARLEEEATGIKEYQEQRKINESAGSIRATQAANGFEEGGSGLYALRENTRQGGVAEGGIAVQGQIQENAFLEEQAKAYGEAQAAKAASQSSMMGGIFSALSGIASLL